MAFDPGRRAQVIAMHNREDGLTMLRDALRASGRELLPEARLEETENGGVRLVVLGTGEVIGAANDEGSLSRLWMRYESWIDDGIRKRGRPVGTKNPPNSLKPGPEPRADAPATLSFRLPASRKRWVQENGGAALLNGLITQAMIRTGDLPKDTHP